MTRMGGGLARPDIGTNVATGAANVAAIRRGLMAQHEQFVLWGSNIFCDDVSAEMAMGLGLC